MDGWYLECTYRKVGEELFANIPGFQRGCVQAVERVKEVIDTVVTHIPMSQKSSPNNNNEALACQLSRGLVPLKYCTIYDGLAHILLNNQNYKVPRNAIRCNEFRPD